MLRYKVTKFFVSHQVACYVFQKPDSILGKLGRFH